MGSLLSWVWPSSSYTSVSFPQVPLPPAPPSSKGQSQVLKGLARYQLTTSNGGVHAMVMAAIMMLEANSKQFCNMDSVLLAKQRTLMLLIATVAWVQMFQTPTHHPVNSPTANAATHGSDGCSITHNLPNGAGNHTQSQLGHCHSSICMHALAGTSMEHAGLMSCCTYHITVHTVTCLVLVLGLICS